jgi:hypothetical protein
LQVSRRAVGSQNNGERAPFGITASAQDEELSLVGYVLSRTKWKPDDIAAMDGDTLSFSYYWLKKSEDEWWERLAKLLGVLWTSEDLSALRGNQGGGKSRSVLMPLLIGLRPELREHLERVLEGDSSVTKADINLADLPKEEFLKWAQQAVRL